MLENIKQPETKSRSFPNHNLQIKEKKFSTNIKTYFKVNTANILKGEHCQIKGTNTVE